MMITLMIEAVRTYETFYSNENTQRYIPEGAYLHTFHRESLKSQEVK
jgi:hypothetical protein